MYLCCAFGWGESGKVSLCAGCSKARSFNHRVSAFVPLEQVEHTKRAWESWAREWLRWFCVPDCKPRHPWAGGHLCCTAGRGTARSPEEWESAARPTAASYQINLQHWWIFTFPAVEIGFLRVRGLLSNRCFFWGCFEMHLTARAFSVTLNRQSIRGAPLAAGKSLSSCLTDEL